VFAFAFDLINSSSDGEARKMAIEMLGHRMYYDAIPLLLSHVKKDISLKEKIAIGKALAFMDRKADAVEILDCNCYGMEYMDNDCIETYFFLLDQLTAIKYFEYYFNKPETQLEAASKLASLGFYDKTFPLFVEFLENNSTYKRETVYSLAGLAAIGTEEALEVIKKYAKNDQTLTSNTAASILDEVMKGRKEK
jgi:HEAT repeat protein